MSPPVMLCVLSSNVWADLPVVQFCLTSCGSGLALGPDWLCAAVANALFILTSSKARGLPKNFVMRFAARVVGLRLPESFPHVRAVGHLVVVVVEEVDC